SADRFESLAGPVAEHLLGLVVEPEEIAFAGGLPQEGGLALHGLQREEIECADPVDLEEGAHEEEVAGKHHGLLLVLDVHRLVAGGVATGNPHPDPRRELRVAIDHQQPALLLEQGQVLGLVGWPAPRIGMTPGLELTGLHHVLRPRKERGELAVPAGRDQGAHMVEVEMAEHHQVDILRLESSPGQGVRQPGIAVVGVDIALLFRQLRSDPGLDQHVGVWRPDQQAVGRHQDAITRVRSLELFPHHLRNHPEDGTPIHPPLSVAEAVQLEPPQLARRSRDHAALNPWFTKSMMACSEVPGPKISTTPIFFRASASSWGMMPPPNTTMSEALRSLSSSRMRGISVMCAPLCRLTPIASTSSWMAASTTISGVCLSPA